MHTIAIALAAATLASIPAAAGADEERGRELYENHCQACHESWVHTRSTRKVTSLVELKQRIQSWSIHSDLDWTSSEIGDVSEYLGTRFYDFGHH